MSKTAGKRFQIFVPQELEKEMESISVRKGTTIPDLIRKFIKLGLLVDKIESTPEATLLVRERDKERELILL